jgi:hypothetical protein
MTPWKLGKAFARALCRGVERLDHTEAMHEVLQRHLQEGDSRR